MPLQQAIPILAYLDEEKTVGFYTGIGFKCHARWPGYLIFSRDSIEIHLWQCDDISIPKNTGCYIRVDRIAELYAEYALMGCIHPNGNLEEKPWGMSQFSILDNSGNILHFGEPMPGND